MKHKSRVNIVNPTGIGAVFLALFTLPAAAEKKFLFVPPGTGALEGGQLPPSAPDGGPPAAPEDQPVVVHAVDKAKELMITSLKVVESDRATNSNGPWHIKTLMQNLNGGNEPSRMMIELLAQWETNTEVNDFNIPARQQITSLVIQPWIEKSGQVRPQNSGNWANFKLNWDQAPFRLLAIVNRMDLASDPNLGPIEDAGEGRFVFGILDSEGSALPFTFIFEYQLQAKDRAAFDNWAKSWHALGSHSTFGATYLAALEGVTDRFAGNRTFNGVKPILNQLRTNEIALADPWELREFNVGGGRFVPATVKQNPDLSFVGTSQLTQFLASGPSGVPAILKFKDSNGTDRQTPFLAASSLNPIPRPVWTAPNIQSERLHTFALNTCNGCHGVEGGMEKFEFTMVQVRDKRKESKLAGFLTGKAPSGPLLTRAGATTFPDPREPWRQMSYKNDLEARSRILQRLVNPEAGFLPAAPGELSVPADSLMGRNGRIH